MKRLVWSLLPAIALAAACSRPELRPAQGALVAAADKEVAFAKTNSVRFWVDGSAWKGFPKELDEVVPVQVTIENNSGVPIRINYQSLALVSPDGTEYDALPPRTIHGTEMVDIPVNGWGAPYLGYHHFYYPYYAWGGPFWYGPYYYDTYYTRWPIELPTGDMLAHALREGVIQSGNGGSGFVYFEGVPDNVKNVHFRAEVTNAQTGESMGVVDIPFEALDA
jgi:hypothetical protein